MDSSTWSFSATLTSEHRNDTCHHETLIFPSQTASARAWHALGTLLPQFSPVSPSSFTPIFDTNDHETNQERFACTTFS